MLITIALIISILLQFFAAFVGFRLILITKGKVSWILISIAFLFMAVRRIIEVLSYIHQGDFQKLALVNVWLGIIISIFIAAGVILIGEIFYSIKRAEKARLESEKKFKTLFNSSSDEILVVDFNGNIVEVNQTICDALRYSKEEFIKMHIKDINSEKYIEMRLPILEEIKESGLHTFESEHLSKDGKIIPIEIISRIIDYNNSKAILLIGRDITERKQTERKILNAMIETEEKDRKRFAKDLHDGLGSLLSSIGIYIGLLKTTDDEDEKQNLLDYSKGLIDEAVHNTKEIANNLMPSVISRFGLVTSVKTFCNKINNTGLINISVNVDDTFDDKLDNDLGVTLYRIINELINNTLKHAFADKIEINFSKEKKYLILTYSDNGIGFDFDKVMKAKTYTGMGLSNILSRVKVVNGTCKIISSKETGTNVIIKIKL